jgi:hypothetical protein
MYSLVFKEGRTKKFGSLREAAEWLAELLQRNPVAALAPPAIRCRGTKLDSIDEEVWNIYKRSTKNVG